MDTHEIQSRINWYGRDYLVRVTWNTMSGNVVAVRCLIDGKDVVKFVKGRWIDRKGKRYDPDNFAMLQRCCTDNFREARFVSLAFVPIFSIYLGEDM